MLRDKSAVTQLRILPGLAEKVIRDLARLPEGRRAVAACSAVSADRHSGMSVNSVDLRSWLTYGGRDRLADLAVRARDRLSPRGFKKCQEVDPAWPPA
jgi:hypothetical protein